MPFGASERLGYDARPFLVLRALIHWSAWNRYSANFAFWAFCEVRIHGVLGSCPGSECWKMTLLSSVLRRFASWESHKDHRQGQHSEAHAGVEPPPQATY